jgi:hypothetical protein
LKALTPTLSQRERELEARTLKLALSQALSLWDDCMDAGGIPNTTLGNSAASGTGGCRVTQGTVTERIWVRSY